MRRSTFWDSVRTAFAVGVVSAAFAAPASATVPVVPSGAGLTIPGALAVAPGGDVWVADELLGACRVADGTLVQDGNTCGPEGTTTGGPAAASGIAFGSTPAGTFLYVADPSSGNSGIWRLPYDAATGTTGPGTRILGTGDSRPSAIVLNPTGALEYTIERDTRLRRIASPDVCTPGVSPCSATSVTDLGQEILSLAYLGSALLYPTPAGVTTIAEPDVDPTPTLAPGFPAGAYSAVATDPATGRVYAATSDPSGARVLVREGDAPASVYASGFSGVTAMTVAPDGTLLVADDPSLAAGGSETAGQGRIFAVEPHAANLPEASIVSAPPPLGRDATATFGIAGPDGVSLECRVDPADWSPCGSGPTASVTIDLPTDGSYTFRVRAVNGTLVGGESSYVVTRDTVAPLATIDTTTTSFLSTAVRVAFSADEALVDWTCALDGGAPVPCYSPFRPAGLTPGTHEVQVVPTDQAGNVGPGARHAFEVVPPPPTPRVVEEDQKPGGESSGPGPGPDPVPPAPAPDTSGPSAPVAPLVVPKNRCWAVGADRTAPNFTPGPRRSFVLRLRTPKGARWVTLTARHRGGTMIGKPVKIQVARVKTSPGRVFRLAGRFSPSTYRLLRSGKYRLGVAFGTCPSSVGKARIAFRAGAWRGPVA